MGACEGGSLAARPGLFEASPYIDSQLRRRWSALQYLIGAMPVIFVQRPPEKRRGTGDSKLTFIEPTSICL
jgi:hypothetical protein